MKTLESTVAAFHDFCEAVRALNGENCEVVCLVLKEDHSPMTISTMPPELTKEAYNCVANTPVAEYKKRTLQ